MRPNKGSYDAEFVKDFLMDNSGNNGKNNTPTEVLMLPAGNLDSLIRQPKLHAS